MRKICSTNAFSDLIVTHSNELTRIRGIIEKHEINFVACFVSKADRTCVLGLGLR